MDMKLLNDAGLNTSDHVLKMIVGLAGALGDCLIAWGLPKEKADPLMMAVTILAGLLVLMIGHVQANKLKAQGQIAAAGNTPAPQNNINSDVTNAPAAPVVPPSDTAPLTRADAQSLIKQGIEAYIAHQQQLVKQRAAAVAARPLQPPQGKTP